MATIGTAYINIAPNMTGIQGKIAGGLRGTGSQFADQFGGEISGRSAVVIGAISGLVSSATSAGLNLMSSQFSAAISRFDTIQNFPKVMQNFGISTGDATAAMAVLVKGVHSLPTSLNDIVSLSEAFTPMSSGIGQAAKLALALNDALLAGGAPMQVQQAAMEQFRQALAKGMPQLQDWRSLESAMPAQLQQIAKALGLGSGALKDYGVNGQGLYNAMQDGKVSMTDFNNTLLTLDKTGLGTLPNFQTQAKNASNGVGTAFTVLKQSIQQVMVDIMTSIGQENIANAIKGIGTAIKTAYTDIKAVIEFVVRYKDVFGPLAAGIGAVALAIGAWKTAIAIWTGITKVATAVQAAFNLVMASQPHYANCLGHNWFGSGTGLLLYANKAWQANMGRFFGVFGDHMGGIKGRLCRRGGLFPRHMERYKQRRKRVYTIL
jgi:tape measure domain-containing protein